MKIFASPARAELEPGLMTTFRLVAVIFLVFQPISRRWLGLLIGVNAPLEINLLLTVPGALALVVFLFVPWFPQRLGRAFLPIALALASFPPIIEKFITINWFMPAQAQELIGLLFMLRTWFVLQMVTFMVGWQYDMRWTLFAGVGLTTLDALVAIPFMNPAGPLWVVFVSVVGARLVIVTGISLGVAWLMQRQRAQRTELQQANRKLALTATTVEQLAVSHERNRMARELHDTLAHSLSAVSVQLEAVNALWDVEPAEARKILEHATTSTRSGLTEARRALHSLRASPLEDLGLTLALSTLAESVAARGNLKLELDVTPNVEGLQPQVEQCIYRVAQEALENVTRHADASNVRVGLEKMSGHLALTIADDGIGFEPTNVNGEHFGLQGMRERAEMAGGTLSVASAPRQGTRVRLEINN